ncbi:MAG: N-acetyltransferase [Acidimicrobiia bacterium]|nr:N-acetyltransferase [Acidimicrobiia bacterium]
MKTRPEDVFVHPDGRCESDSVGALTRVWAFAHVLKGAVVGSGCNLGDHTYVEDGAVLGNNVTIKNGVQVWSGVTLEDDVFVGPNATFTNDLRPRAFIKKHAAGLDTTLVRRGATIGANATIVCGTVLGEESLVAAGAVVTRDVAAHALVAGNPARRVAWACTCGETLPPSLECESCGRRFALSDKAVGLSPAP